MTTDRDREAFEAWAKAVMKFTLMERAGETYMGAAAECSWMAWQAALAHAPAPQPGGVKVKALEWGNTSYGTPEIYSVVGVYRINHAENGGWTAVHNKEVIRSRDGRTNFPTVEAAKAAAQADYERCILSALDPSSSGCGAGAEAKIKETLMASREFWDGLQQIRNGNWSESHFAGVIEHIILPTPPAGEG